MNGSTQHCRLHVSLEAEVSQKWSPKQRTGPGILPTFVCLGKGEEKEGEDLQAKQHLSRLWDSPPKPSCSCWPAGSRTVCWPCHPPSSIFPGSRTCASLLPASSQRPGGAPRESQLHVPQQHGPTYTNGRRHELGPWHFWPGWSLVLCTVGREGMRGQEEVLSQLTPKIRLRRKQGLLQVASTLLLILDNVRVIYQEHCCTGQHLCARVFSVTNQISSIKTKFKAIPLAFELKIYVEISLFPPWHAHVMLSNTASKNTAWVPYPSDHSSLFSPTWTWWIYIV